MINISNCKLIILTFIITGLWDVMLRILSMNFDKLPYFMKNDFIKILIPYFNHHTILSAALIAGFIGAVTQLIIINLIKFPNYLNIKSNVIFLIISFIISALFGFIMKFSKLFPILDKTYYKHLGTFRSMYHDGISGVIVQITLFIIYLIINY
jgi:hypothetical protein